MTEVQDLHVELEKIKQTLQSLAEFGVAEDQAPPAVLARKAELEATLSGSGAIAQGDGSIAAGEGAAIYKDVAGSIIVNAEKGARVVIGEEAVKMSRELRGSDLGRYLEYIIAHNRYLQLQGIRSGGKLVNIELEQIYIRLRATRQRSVQAEEMMLDQEASLAPGERHRSHPTGQLSKETVTVNVEEALAEHRHIVILGDPGSGKTTLLRYLALLYGRDLAEKKKGLRRKLKLNESGYLPILLPLRQIGQFIKAHHAKNDGTDGHALLLDFLLQTLKNRHVEIPVNYFEKALNTGQAVVLLDGMDEVADPDLRARVARLIEDFTLAYPKARFIVTSRIVGYSGAARLSGDYVITTVRDFTLEDVRQFLSHWHRLVAVGQMGAVESAKTFAASQTSQLMSAIQANERVRDLAINPLMLTVIALVHRDRVKLPDRRAELYAEAVDVLLGKWDEARGVKETEILAERPFDAGDRRLLLQRLALHMHEMDKKEIQAGELRRFLKEAFLAMGSSESDARRAVARVLKVIEERTGLLTARGEGIYAFSHLTFQEYLAALAITARDDYIAYVLQRSDEPWWKEVILLTAGYLSTQSTERTTNLIRAIAEKKQNPIPYHNLVLASECARDAGINRVEGSLASYIERELRKNLRAPIPFTARILGKRGGLRSWVERRAEVIQALTRAGSGYWAGPYGEPEWITIPAGKFWMGGNSKYDGKPMHEVELPEYKISRVPVTNYQYGLFVKATEYAAPSYWEDKHPPKGLESHPVVNVNWDDAITYIKWISKMTGKKITLPSEAEWEKAARGDKDKRAYPWGDNFDKTRCNSSDLGLGGTTPTGIFLEGESPYGLLDMSGNAWEWTRSAYKGYPYNSKDGREDLSSRASRVLRGGSFDGDLDLVRCASRNRSYPNYRNFSIGFRLVVSPSSSY
jgi:formylglycine-generating enzyme required for sulfatase activity/energy-coupling factor transporter ATP-binding protein EcfA2